MEQELIEMLLRLEGQINGAAPVAWEAIVRGVYAKSVIEAFVWMSSIPMLLYTGYRAFTYDQWEHSERSEIIFMSTLLFGALGLLFFVLGLVFGWFTLLGLTDPESRAILELAGIM